MSASVHTKPAKIDPNTIKSNAAVRSSTWQDTAQVLNTTLGHGAVLVPVTMIGETINAQNVRTYRFRARPTLGVSMLRWVLGVRSTAPNITVQALGNSDIIPVSSSWGSTPIRVERTYSGGTSADLEYSITLTASTLAALTVDYIALYELSRASLVATEGGIDINPLLVGNPIFDKSGQGYAEIARSIEAAPSRTRRVGCFHWARSAGRTVTGTTSIPQLNLSAPVLGRRLYRNTGADETVRTLSFRVYASAVSAVGYVDVTTDKFHVTPVTVVVGNSAGWYPDPAGPPAQITVDSEAMSSVNGLQSGTFDAIKLGFRCATPTGSSMTVYAVSFWEDDQDVQP